jgi:4-hydroxy-tetrahydrodipicolinate reductase
MKSYTRIAHFGLGVIGVEAIKALADKPWANIVGAIDVDPAKVGRSLGEITGVGKLAGISVVPTLEQLLTTVQPDVIVHAAGSSAAISFDQIEPMIRRGISVVSSCEQLLFPALREPARARYMHSLCIENKAGIVGTGVNPGFVMDVLPLTLTGVCRSVRHIYVEREVNASTRRMQLQKKIGSGMPPDEFRALFAAGKAGHAGFAESAAMICHCMGWENPKISETCQPIVAGRKIQTEFFTVPEGRTSGLHQVVTATVDGLERLKMDLKMHLDAAKPHDAIQITGSPSLNLMIDGGVAGDVATVAAMVNAIPRLQKAGPGLHLMTDLPVPVMH